MEFDWTPPPPLSILEVTLIFWPWECIPAKHPVFSTVLSSGLYENWSWSRMRPLKLTTQSRKLVPKGTRWSKKRGIWDIVTMSVQKKTDKKVYPFFFSKPISISVFGERKLLLWKPPNRDFLENFHPFSRTSSDTPMGGVPPKRKCQDTPRGGVRSRL